MKNKMFSLFKFFCIFLTYFTFFIQFSESGGCDAAVPKTLGSFPGSLCYLPKKMRTCPSLTSLVDDPSKIASFEGCKVAVCTSLDDASCKWKTAKDIDCCLDYDNNRVCIDTTNDEYIKYSRWRRYRLYFKDTCTNSFHSEIDIPNTRYANGYSKQACDYIYGSVASPKPKCSPMSSPPGPPAGPPTLFTDGTSCSCDAECQSGLCSPSGGGKRSDKQNLIDKYNQMKNISNQDLILDKVVDDDSDVSKLVTSILKESIKTEENVQKFEKKGPASIYEVCYTKKGSSESCQESWQCSSDCCSGSTCAASGCFTADTLVYLDDGVTQKKVIDLKIGDRLLGLNGESNIVLDVVPTEKKSGDLYSINGLPTFFTDDHEFLDPENSMNIQQVSTVKSLNIRPNFTNFVSMREGGKIYQYNPLTKKFDSIVIETMTRVNQDSHTVYSIQTYSASLTNSYTGNGILSGIPGIYGPNAISYGVRFYIYSKISQKLNEDYQTYISSGYNISRKDYFSKLGFSIQSKLEKLIVKSSIEEVPVSSPSSLIYNKEWFPFLESYYNSANNEINEDAKVISDNIRKLLKVRLPYVDVNTGRNFLDNYFIPSLLDLITSNSL